MTQKDVTISAIAQNLNLYTLQGVAVSPTEFVVPTLDGTLLHINYIATLSTDVVEVRGLLLRISAAGVLTKIAELNDFGNPFGVGVMGGDFVVVQSKRMF